MRQEVANVYNWFQNFSKYLEGMKLLEYPKFFISGRKKSTEILEMEKLSNNAISVSYSKNKDRDTEDDKTRGQVSDQSPVNLLFGNSTLKADKMLSSST